MFFPAVLTVAAALSGIANGQVTLGTAAAFGVLAGSDITNTGLTVVNGNIGVYPGTSITGFPPGVATGATDNDDAVAQQAEADATTAFNTLAGLPATESLQGQDLGGLTLTAGVYNFASSGQLTGALTLDGQGNANSQFVFQFGSTFTTASASSVVLINGAQACNVYFQVGSSATIGTDTTLAGNILAQASITVNTGASVQGGLYALTGAVTLDDNAISPDNACVGGVTSSSSSATPTASSSTVSQSSSMTTTSSSLTSASTKSSSASTPSKTQTTTAQSTSKPAPTTTITTTWTAKPSPCTSTSTSCPTSTVTKTIGTTKVKTTSTKTVTATNKHTTTAKATPCKTTAKTTSKSSAKTSSTTLKAYPTSSTTKKVSATSSLKGYTKRNLPSYSAPNSNPTKTVTATVTVTGKQTCSSGAASKCPTPAKTWTATAMATETQTVWVTKTATSDETVTATPACTGLAGYGYRFARV